MILRLRRQHRTWGPKKLRKLLRRDHGIRRPPAASTIAGILLISAYAKNEQEDLNRRQLQLLAQAVKAEFP